MSVLYYFCVLSVSTVKDDVISNFDSIYDYVLFSRFTKVNLKIEVR